MTILEASIKAISKASRELDFFFFSRASHKDSRKVFNEVRCKAFMQLKQMR